MVWCLGRQVVAWWSPERTPSEEKEPAAILDEAKNVSFSPRSAVLRIKVRHCLGRSGR